MKRVAVGLRECKRIGCSRGRGTRAASRCTYRLTARRYTASVEAAATFQS